ncbi:GlxA family transcriptional regulator [Acidovorax sp. NPDC077693]|uniref:GlxA family transcriptional regulator n=1 Tax=unclassified Acidovorax TaxID=2684926 RepID=UPI0037C56D8D
MLPADASPLPRPDVRLLLMPLPDFALLPFGAFLDKLRFSADDEDRSRQRYCAWTLMGIDGAPVVSSSGVQVSVDTAADAVDLAAYDYLVVFGSRTVQASLAHVHTHGAVLRRAAARGVPLVAIDNASFLLAGAGLLTGRRVALHWRHVAEFRHAFPRIAVASEQIYCFDRDRITCAGGTAAIDMAAELLSRHCGRERAFKGLADMLVDGPRHQGHALQSMEGGGPDLGRHVARAVALMRSSMADGLTVAGIAERIGIGRRQLDRLFTERFGHSAHDHWTTMRMEHAHWRVTHSHHSLSAIADEVGLGNASSLARLFRRHYGTSPGAVRAGAGRELMPKDQFSATRLPSL